MIQKQQNEVLGHPLPISTYLLKPFQRILKYPELLKVSSRNSVPISIAQTGRQRIPQIE